MIGLRSTPFSVRVCVEFLAAWFAGEGAGMADVPRSGMAAGAGPIDTGCAPFPPPPYTRRRRAMLTEM